MINRLIVLAFFVSGLNVAAKTVKVEYRIDIDMPVHHMAKVEADFPKHSTDDLIIQLPVWRSGRYEILDFSDNLREFSVTDSKGKPVSFIQLDKARWQIKTLGQKITVHYRIYANELGDRTRHIDDSHAFLDASSVLVYSPLFRNTSVSIELEVPKKWRSRSGMVSEGKHRFVADNYDVLIDSPIETGIHDFYTFGVADRDYEILFWGRGDHDAKKIINDLKKLDVQVEKIWKSFPYSRYLYMIHATEGPRGATEHINSTVIQRQRDKFSSRKDYLNFIYTAAHELIHTWNVKAYRPANLVPYDFQSENYSNLLWIAEGTTSYFDNLIVRRAKISTQTEFHKSIAESISKHLSRPGRKVQSVSQSSFNQWIESTNDFTINHGVNIYSEGSLVSWALDFEIRSLSDNQISLEDLHRLLYQRFPVNVKAYTQEDVLALLKELTNADFSSFWAKHVDGVEPIRFAQMLDKVGLQIKQKTEEKQSLSLGIKTDKGLKLLGVLKGSPGWDAGLTKGDVLVSFDRLRLTNDNIKLRTKNLSAGKSVLVHFFRRDELMSVTIVPKLDPNQELTIEPVAEPSDEQQQWYQSWTGQSLELVGASEKEIKDNE